MFTIEVDSHSEADQVLEGAQQLIKKYDYLSKADLLEMVGQLGTYQDVKIGWLTLDGVSVDRTIDGLSSAIAFPNPSPLDI